MEYIIDGLIVENYHTYIYGASGSGKTTVMLNLCFEMVAKGYTVYFLYLDGELFSAAKVQERIEQDGLQGRYNILTEGTMHDYASFLKTMIAQKTDLSKTVFILDTFKFLSDDVNNKNANKTAMHFIKDIKRNGATFISLGHTNKDGRNQSGTAEIEQDCDTLLRIDSHVDGSNVSSTIKKGGRARCTVKQTSFAFTGGDPLSVELLHDVFDIETVLKEESEAKADYFFIKEVKKLLFNGGEKTQKELLELLSDFDLGTNKKKQKLNKYIGKEWNEKKGDKNASIYYLNDDFLKQWAALEPPIKEEKAQEPDLFE